MEPQDTNYVLTMETLKSGIIGRRLGDYGTPIVQYKLLVNSMVNRE